MKRIAAGIVVLAVLLAGLPPALGIVYERQVRAQFDAMPANPLLRVELADYQRGLYSSEGVWVIGFTDEFFAQFREMLAEAEPDSAEGAAIAESVLELLRGEMRFDATARHGPVTFDDGIQLGLATVRGELNSSSGNLADFQQHVNAPFLFRYFTRVNFDGSQSYTGTMPAFDNREAADKFVYDFSGMQLSGGVSAQLRDVDVSGGADFLRFKTPDGRFAIEGIAFNSDQTRLTEFLWTGSGKAIIGEIQASSASGLDNLSMKGLGMSGSVELNEAGTQIDMEVAYLLDTLETPDMELRDLVIGLNLNNVDVVAASDYMALTQTPEFALAQSMEPFMPQLLPIAEQFLRGSPSISLKPFRFNFEDQTVNASFDLAFNGGAMPEGASIEMLAASPLIALAAVTANGRIEAPEAIIRPFAASIMKEQILGTLTPESEFTMEDVDAAASQQAEQGINGLVEQGMVKRSKNGLSTELSFANGKLSVNGELLPLGQF